MLMTQRETQPLPESGRQEHVDQQPICIFPKDWAKSSRAQVKQGGCRRQVRKDFLTLKSYQLFERIE